MNWDEIMQYEDIIKKIASKYAGDPDLAKDTAQEVMLKLFEDKNLDTSKFNPAKKDAAIRNTIRNKTIKVLTSKKTGRWQHASLDSMLESGIQINEDGEIIIDDVASHHDRARYEDGYYYGNISDQDTDAPPPEDS